MKLLRVSRDPTNEHDAMALVVHIVGDHGGTVGGTVVGYIPRQTAAVLSPLLDAGCIELVGVILSSEGQEVDQVVAVELKIAVAPADPATSEYIVAALDSLLPAAGGPEEAERPFEQQVLPAPLVVHRSESAGLGVVSLFSGISADKVALDSVGMPVRLYCSSEIEEPANVVARAAMARSGTKVRPASPKCSARILRPSRSAPRRYARCSSRPCVRN